MPGRCKFGDKAPFGIVGIAWAVGAAGRGALTPCTGVLALAGAVDWAFDDVEMPRQPFDENTLATTTNAQSRP